MRKYEYLVTQPRLRPGATSPVMDFYDMSEWLNEMDANGWEFTGYGQKNWLNSQPQSWWIFRRRVKNRNNSEDTAKKRGKNG